LPNIVNLIQFIDFCVQNGTTGAQTISWLLRGKFSGRKIHQKNLYNAIQAAKKKLTSRAESSDLMKFLYSQQADDLQPLDDNNQMPYNEASGSNNNEKDNERLVKIVGEKVIIGQHANLLIRTRKLFNYIFTETCQTKTKS
jgi:hypothetical protein